ncbi:MAG: AmmeMemoRadiSam system protein B [Steroidobacteraceae bacterium]
MAGSFYPQDPRELSATVAALLAGKHGSAQPPKALIVPHAGYVYSGSVAAQAYASLGAAARELRRVLLLGPSHREWFRGLAVSTVQSFATPLGMVRVDTAAVSRLCALSAVMKSDAAHALEHSLEVQLPFLQHVAPAAEIVPVVAGDASPAEVAGVIEELWDGAQTLIVVSSDLSHYHSYRTARELDGATAQAIVEGRTDLLGEQACGCVLVNGLSLAVRAHGLHAAVLDLRNSGDTAGDKQRVVGYGAFGFFEP